MMIAITRFFRGWDDLQHSGVGLGGVLGGEVGAAVGGVEEDEEKDEEYTFVHGILIEIIKGSIIFKLFKMDKIEKASKSKT